MDLEHNTSEEISLGNEAKQRYLVLRQKVYTPEEYLLMAYDHAVDSPDPSTQNGAVIVTKEMIVGACNTFPRGVKTTPERLERPLKYQYIEHAERGVVQLCAKYGYGTAGATMYACWAACADCARQIINAGITKVVTHKRMADATPDRWKESIKEAFVMFDEAGVEVEMVPTFLNGPQIRFNGELWQP